MQPRGFTVDLVETHLALGAESKECKRVMRSIEQACWRMRGGWSRWKLLTASYSLTGIWYSNISSISGRQPNRCTEIMGIQMSERDDKDQQVTNTGLHGEDALVGTAYVDAPSIIWFASVLSLVHLSSVWGILHCSGSWYILYLLYLNTLFSWPTYTHPSESRPERNVNSLVQTTRPLSLRKSFELREHV